MRSPQLAELKDILCGGGAIQDVSAAPCPRQGRYRIVTIIVPVGQDARPVKTKNKLGKIAVIFIDI